MLPLSYTNYVTALVSNKQSLFSITHNCKILLESFWFLQVPSLEKNGDTHAEINDETLKFMCTESSMKWFFLEILMF